MAAPPPLAALQARRRIAAHAIPVLFALYIIAYLDRTSIAFAKLGLVNDLGFSEAVFGFGVGIFHIGYVVFEIPGALIVERYGARRWFAGIVAAWGLCTIALG